MLSLLNDALEIIRAGDPYRTGALKDSFKVIEYEDGFGIYTDLFYMQFTEEQWGYHSGWGKTLINPHEGWFNERALLIAEMVAHRLGGVVNVIR